MTAFWLAAAVMILVALAAVLPPLLGRYRQTPLSRRQVNVAVYQERLAELDADRAQGALDEAAHHAAREELERAMLEDLGEPAEKAARALAPSPIAAVIIAVAVPLAAFGLYFSLGTPDALDERNRQAAAPSAPEHPSGEMGELGSVTEMVERLAERLAADPENTVGWLMLGRSYVALGEHQKAKIAFDEVLAREPDNADAMIGAAEAIASLNGNELAGEPARLLDQALAIAPDHPKGLWFAGIAAYQRDDGAQAVVHWERLQAQAGLDEEQRQMLAALIAEARGGEPPASAPVSPEAQTETAPGASITVRVSLAETVASRAAPADTVFVYARAADGPRIPLAMVKTQVSELPATVTLSDAMAMMPALKLSGFPEVVVGARVSKSGDAKPAPGDLQGISAKLRPAETDSVAVSIADVIP